LCIRIIMFKALLPCVFFYVAISTGCAGQDDSSRAQEQDLESPFHYTREETVRAMSILSPFGPDEVRGEIRDIDLNVRADGTGTLNIEGVIFQCVVKESTTFVTEPYLSCGEKDLHWYKMGHKAGKTWTMFGTERLRNYGP
jgi:hypothetical protein